MKNIILALPLALFIYCLTAAPVKQAHASDIPQWQAMKIMDVDAMPWDDSWAGLRGTSKGKKLFSNDQGAFMLYVSFDPGWDALNKSRHYHNFHEWGYVLEGDFLLYEFISPHQTKGSLYTMRPGTWMSRPPFSIHGNRADAMQHQRITPGSVQLAFIEGGKNYSLDPDNKWYSADWKNVKQFTSPTFQNSALPGVMEWEDAQDLPGASVKWLSDDWQDGFRARILYVPPGWSHPNAPIKNYFEKAQRFTYVLSGDLQLTLSDNAEDEGRTTTIGKDFFIDQAPMSIWGWGKGPLTQKGFMWLEVTYAEGARIGNGPIESIKSVK